MSDFTELPQFKLETDLIRLLPEDYCRKHYVVVLGPFPTTGGPVPLGMVDPGNDAVAEEVEQLLGKHVRRIQLNHFEVGSALAFGFGRPRPARGDTEEGARPEGGKELLMLNPNCKIRFDLAQSPNEILEDTLSEAVMKRATDIHIETYENDVDLRFRIDGMIHQVTTPLSVANIKAVLSRMKVLADLDIANRRTPQDGRLNAQFTDATGKVRRISFRAAILPGPFGEDAVLRVLDEERTRPGLGDLGMSPRVLQDFREMIAAPGGLILVTGPTASGKTTTLYAGIQTISETGKKILTVEDPIEFEIPKVNQKQVNANLSFAGYARAFMRQNPDVLMIGEIRDEETASIALKAAQMGHLVFSTLHTPDAISAIGRLMMLGIEKSLLLATLLGIMSQRLVRKVCPSCRIPHTPDPKLLARIPPLPPGSALMKGKGCGACGKTGYYDRIGVFELIRIHEQLREEILLAEDVALGEIAKKLETERLLDDAIRKVVQGITTLEEVIRVVPLRHQQSLPVAG